MHITTSISSNKDFLYDGFLSFSFFLNLSEEQFAKLDIIMHEVLYLWINIDLFDATNNCLYVCFAVTLGNNSYEMLLSC